jgi:hypothetical protein
MAAAAVAGAAAAAPAPTSPRSLAFTGDVTALIAVAPELARGDGGGVLLAGVGRQLHAFALPSGRRLAPLAGALPPGARVHGAAACAAPGGGAWVAAHGDRHAALFLLKDDGAGGAAWAPLLALPRQPAWTLAARLAPAPPPARGALLALGLADGSLAIYHVSLEAAGAAAPAARLMRRALGAAGRGTLWCMDLHLDAAPGAPPRVLVAAGSAAREVVVWAVDTSLPAAGDAADDAERLEALRLEGHAAAAAPPPPPAPLFCLAGHGGAVHGARWAPGGAALATCSDDRSLRLWDLSDLAAAARARPPPPTAVLAPRLTLFGHTARLWRACFAGGLVFSASEDGTWRAWEEESGACVAAARAHGGRGAWRAAVAGGALYTGGADGAVRAWRLEDWLPAAAAARLGAPAPRWALAPAPPLPPPPGAPAGGGGGRAEWPRALALAPGGAALYAGTNWGLLYRLDLAPAGGPAVLPPPAGAPDSDSASTASAWRLLYASPRRSPFKALALRCAPRGGAAVLAACDNDGHAVALRLGAGGAVAEAWDWRPPAPALGIFLGGGLPPGGAFVAGAAGRLALWALLRGAPPRLVAEDAAPLPGQVVALDARLEGAAAAAAEGGAGDDGEGWAGADGLAALDALVATGGACGGVALWRLAGGALAPLAAARRAHERAIVRGVRLAPRGAPAGLASCGGDGALRRHFLRRVGAGAAAPWALALVGEARCEGVPVLCGDSSGPAEGRAEDLDDAVADHAGAHDHAGAQLMMPRPRALFGFRDAWLVAWDASAACEAARVRCGGRRRPAAFAVAGPDDLTAAFLAGHSDGDREVMLYRRWPPPAGAPLAPARLLLAPLHGRPLAAAALLPLPRGGAALVSAGEDGALRQALWRAPPAGAPAGAGAFAAAALLAEHAAGTEPKALRALPLGGAAAPPRWLLVSAGSKRVLVAWELSAAPPQLLAAGPAAPPLAAEWLATRAGAASPARRGAAVADADHRCVALEAFFPAAALLPPGAGAGADAEALALVAAAAGDGSAELLALDRRLGAPAAARWRPVARLEHAAGLLLCLAHLEVAGAGGAAGAAPPPRHLLFAGGTDGSIVGWDLTAVARAFLAAFHSSADGAAAAWAPRALAPALAAPGAHQSGVNALAAAALPGGAPPLLLSAGDDQALAAWALEARGGGALALRAGARVEGAHASALRGAWTDGAAALTAGADQRLRRWRVGAGGASLAPAGCAVVQAAEPAALAAAALPGGALRVAVAGRGLELLEWPAA